MKTSKLEQRFEDLCVEGPIFRSDNFIYTVDTKKLSKSSEDSGKRLPLQAGYVGHIMDSIIDV